MLQSKLVTNIGFLYKVKIFWDYNVLYKFVISVTYSPCLEIAWRFKEATVGNNDRVSLSKEDGGFYHCDINQTLLDDEVGHYKVTD